MRLRSRYGRKFQLNEKGLEDPLLRWLTHTALGGEPLSLAGSVVATLPGNKLTQKDNADSGVPFITPGGPRQSLLLAKDPDQFFWKPYIS